MNPLSRTCARMAKAASKGLKEAKFAGPYVNQMLVRLANARLAAAGLEQRLSQTNAKPKMIDTSSVVLFSGGIYSYIVLFRELMLGRQVRVLHVGDTPASDLAHHLEWAWATEEEALLSAVVDAFRHARGVGTPGSDLDVQVRAPSLVSVPALDDLTRFSLAGELAADTEIGRIVTGHTRHNYDLRLFRDMSGIVSEAYGRKIQFIAPLCSGSPQTAIQGYLDLGFDPTLLLAETYSCEATERKTLQPQCGVCWGCYRRWRVFTDRNWVEKHFEVLPWEGPNFVAHEVRWSEDSEK